jgi:hypothetical protein
MSSMTVSRSLDEPDVPGAEAMDNGDLRADVHGYDLCGR